jgi:uncharacterized membrane protein YqaE (UPF0057 family)
LLPIPSALYPDKYTNKYLEDVISAVYSREAAPGAAYMFFAEWYFAFGWLGLAVASVTLGYALGLLWRWFLRRTDELYAIVLYACLMPFSYVVLSRGYFAQVVMLFCFAAIPGWVYYLWQRRRRQRGGMIVPPPQVARPPGVNFGIALRRIGVSARERHSAGRDPA